MMSYKGAKHVVLPVCIVKIALIYALLLTSGLILACITIYRHEESIAEMRQTLNEMQFKQVNKEIDCVTAEENRDNKQGNLDKVVDMFYGEEVVGMGEDSQPRSRRNLGTNQKNSKNPDNRKNKKNKRKASKRKKRRRGPKGDKGDKGDPGRRGDTGTRGDDGPRGPIGQQGYHGPEGPRGSRGDSGQKGEEGRKGDMGNNGIPGTKGSKGDQGDIGKSLMFSHSAHIVAEREKGIKSFPGPKNLHRMVYWKKKHASGMSYDNNGHLVIAVTGYYFIYSQMFYVDGDNPYVSHEVYIDNTSVLKAVHSVVNSSRKFDTQYTSGIFKIEKGQTISVGTRVARDFHYTESTTFFGAFMLHF